MSSNRQLDRHDRWTKEAVPRYFDAFVQGFSDNGMVYTYREGGAVSYGESTLIVFSVFLRSFQPTRFSFFERNPSAVQTLILSKMLFGAINCIIGEVPIVAINGVSLELPAIPLGKTIRLKVRCEHSNPRIRAASDWRVKP